MRLRKSVWYLPLYGLMIVSLFIAEGHPLHAQESSDPSDHTSDHAGVHLEERFRAGIIEISKQMIQITSSVETVEEAVLAEDRIASAMKPMTELAQELTDNFDQMDENDMSLLENLGSIMDDPDVAHWAEGAKQAMMGLQQKNATAALKLQQLSEKHGEEFAKLMEGLIVKIQYLRYGGFDDEEPEFTP